MGLNSFLSSGRSNLCIDLDFATLCDKHNESHRLLFHSSQLDDLVGRQFHLGEALDESDNRVCSLSLGKVH